VLSLALGGDVSGALKLPRNNVGSKQLERNAVVSSKVKSGLAAER
jgi:hypothetical protein